MKRRTLKTYADSLRDRLAYEDLSSTTERERAEDFKYQAQKRPGAIVGPLRNWRHMEARSAQLMMWSLGFADDRQARPVLMPIFETLCQSAVKTEDLELLLYVLAGLIGHVDEYGENAMLELSLFRRGAAGSVRPLLRFTSDSEERLLGDIAFLHKRIARRSGFVRQFSLMQVETNKVVTHFNSLPTYRCDACNLMLRNTYECAVSTKGAWAALSEDYVRCRAGWTP